LDARKNKAYLFDSKILGAVDLEEAAKLVKGRRVVTDNALKLRFADISQTISYQDGEYQLGQILAEIAITKIKSGQDSDWHKLKPLYIQPPPVFK